MVADRDNDRILLLSFSSQLELERVLIDNTSSQGKCVVVSRTTLLQ